MQIVHRSARGLVALAIAAITFLVAAAVHPAMAAPAAASHAQQPCSRTIQNDTFWKDTDGNLIASQGGGVFRFGDTYYWYGVHYQAADPYAVSPTQKYSTADFASIDVYSSRDAVNWTFRNRVATRSTALAIPTSKDVTGDAFSRMGTLADASWIGRMGVVYNEITHKYVLVAQMTTSYDTNNKTNIGELFLQSDTPTGDFTYADLQTQIPGVVYQGTGDQTVFTDDDGTDYLVFSNQSGRANTYVARIAPSDSLSIEPAVRVAYNSAGREGNAMFKANGHYYIASSDLHGWNASVTHVVESVGDDPQGAYGAETVMAGTEADYSHVSQSGFFFTVHGKKTDTVVYAGDRWADFAWNGTGYNQWVPLSFDGEAPVFHSLSSWQLDAASGDWAVGATNNYVLNPEFEADRIPVTSVTGWTTRVDATSPSSLFVSNPTPGADGSRNALTLGSSAGFSGGVWQQNTIPAGTYKLSVYAKASSGLDLARVRVVDAQGRARDLDLRNAGSSWTEISSSAFKLSAGTVTISVDGAAAAAGTFSVDGLSLVRS